MSRARDRVRDAAGPELYERLEHLDRARSERRRPPPDLPPPDAGATADYDVVVAGGGLWMLLAPMLASAGLSVAVLDRGRVGAAHREWNASASELHALVRAGLATQAELDALVIARYREGVCRFHGGGSYPVRNVLDHAVDAGGLLRLGRAVAVARGVAVLDHHEVVAEAAGHDAIAARVRSPDGERTITARVLVDARGATSPYASADLVCPTVGGVLRGLAEGAGDLEVDPSVGEILATVDDVDDSGRQHVWEGFPGARGETTVYLFYYARAAERVSLLELYERFFDTLPTYKRGDAALVRPTFGYISGWSRLSPPPRAPHPRVVLVGDAAARHSPLTYCGFGATLRSLEGAAAAITRAVERRSGIREASVVDDSPVHALTGALAQVMASREMPGAELNGLLDAAFATLHEMGPSAYEALLRDEMAPALFTQFLRRTAERRGSVWRTVPKTMGLGAAGRWIFAIARAGLTRSARGDAA